MVSIATRQDPTPPPPLVEDSTNLVVRMHSSHKEKFWGLGAVIAWGVVAVAHFSLSSTPKVVSSSDVDGLRLTRSVQAITDLTRDSVVTFVISSPVNETAASGSTSSDRIIGCGIIVDDTGTILTTRRVLDSEKLPEVCLRDGRRFPCVDPQRDDRSPLATVRIENAGQLVAARLGHDRQMTKGDVVVALGRIATNELVTGVGRITAAANAQKDDAHSAFFETDALSSLRIEGMPLVNLSGTVVGIADATDTNTTGKAGRAIALVSSSWLREQLTAASLPATNLGIQVEPVTAEVRARNNLAETSGAVITKLLPNAFGRRTGFQVGDVILMFGDRRVRTPNDLRDAVDSLPADMRRPVEIVRDGWRMTLQLTAPASPTSSE